MGATTQLMAGLSTVGTALAAMEELTLEMALRWGKELSADLQALASHLRRVRVRCAEGEVPTSAPGSLELSSCRPACLQDPEPPAAGGDSLE